MTKYAFQSSASRSDHLEKRWVFSTVMKEEKDCECPNREWDLVIGGRSLISECALTMRLCFIVRNME